MDELKLSVLKAVWNGNKTSPAIEVATEMSESTVRARLKTAYDEGLLERNENVRPYEYAISDAGLDTLRAEGVNVDDPDQQTLGETVADDDDDDGSAPESADVSGDYDFKSIAAGRTIGAFGGEGELVPERDYDWSKYVPDPTEWYDNNGVRAKVDAIIENRESTNIDPKFYIGGPQGAGKTELPKAIASKKGWPLFTVQGSYALNPSDIIGRPFITDGETKWADGTVTKAMLSSLEGPTVLVLDEVNRTRAQAKADLFSVLDSRAELSLPFTGETVRTNPMNLIVFSTMNEGREFVVEKLDAAEKSRLGMKFDVDYLGRDDPDAEAELIAGRAPVSVALAARLVSMANHIRNLAETSDTVKAGIPTRELIRWAKVAAAYDAAGIEKPIVEAAEEVIVAHLYKKDGDETPASREIRQLIDGKFGTMPADPAKFAEEVGDDADGDTGRYDIEESNEVSCIACAFETTRTDAESRDLLKNYECPECGDDLVA